jgi:hypothetical protein
MKNSIVMFLVFLLSIVGIPFVMMAIGLLNDGRLASLGIHTNPNYAGGVVIAEFADPANDLLQPLPEAFVSAAYKNALDLRSFSVTKVAFPPFAGQGIAPRLNLVFEFDGQLPNPYESQHQFSLSVLQVFLDAPNLSSAPAASERIPEVAFADNTWDFQVVIDGFHDQARIYDARGTLIGHSLGIYVKYVTDESPEGPVSKTAMPDGEKNVHITKTRITAALPITLVGDPAHGKWEYYVVIGLADLRSQTGMYPRPFDCIQCRQREVDGVIELYPLSKGIVP